MTITFTASQLSNQALIKVGQITGKDWTESNVRRVLREYADEVVRWIAVDQTKFAGIFGAGRQLGEWAWSELRSRTEEKFEGAPEERTPSIHDQRRDAVRR